MRFWYFTLAVAALTNALPHGPDDDNDAVVPAANTPTLKAPTTDALPSTVTYGYHPTPAQKAGATPVITSIASAASSDAPSCTKTVMHALSFQNLQVCTDYAATTTVSRLFACGGCALKVKAFGGPGPVVRCRTRTQVPMKTVTVMGCGGPADALVSQPTFPAQV